MSSGKEKALEEATEEVSALSGQLSAKDDVEKVAETPEILSDIEMNLCNNAFDAMQGAGHKAQGAGDYEPKITVRTRSENDSVFTEIEDNGPGIPDDIKDKILQPFFTTKKGTQGTGLGLNIIHYIVKAHGGVLNVSTQAAKRTTFTIELPIV
jgi:signal transduction histidine kinase